MNDNKKDQILLLAILVISLIAINYNFLDEKFADFLEDSETGIVGRVIDGDTIVLESGEHLRLLGINTPERNEKYYSEAKGFLEKEVLNKTVKIVFGKEKKDLYNRTLGYIFVDGKNVNLGLVENGLGNFYFPSGKDQYYSKFKKAWNNCIENNKNLCEKSKNVCANCIQLRELSHKNQKAVFYNECSFECKITNWEIKDEGRKKFTFPEFNLKDNSEVRVVVGDGENQENNLFWKNEDYVWTDSGDTLFLRDDKGKLVLWKNY